MVNCDSKNDALFRSVEDLGIKITKEEIESIILEASEKYGDHADVKMHPLTRAFKNLEINRERFEFIAAQN